MAKRINVGLDEFNKVNGGITPLKPPGGHSNLVVGGAELTSTEAGPEAEKVSCRVTQPPGGSSSKLFTQEAAPKKNVAPAKPYRLKSSVVLGSEKPENIVESPRRKSVVRKVNPITGEVEGEAELDMAKLIITNRREERIEKSCSVPPGGHTTRLW